MTQRFKTIFYGITALLLIAITVIVISAQNNEVTQEEQLQTMTELKELSDFTIKVAHYAYKLGYGHGVLQTAHPTFPDDEFKKVCDEIIMPGIRHVTEEFQKSISFDPEDPDIISISAMRVVLQVWGELADSLPEEIDCPIEEPAKELMESWREMREPVEKDDD